MQNNVVYLDDFRPMKPLEDYAPQFGGSLPEGFGYDFEPIKLTPKKRAELIKYELLGFVVFMAFFGLCMWLWFILP